MRRGLIDISSFLITLAPILIAIAIVYFQSQALVSVMKSIADKFNQIILVKGDCPVSIVRQA